ncbi:DUF1127 domain-containing protein [Labrys wisconsinensis]|uniref:Uncharacterized protein YjiS (DUF1127 family) n=1 Tax=Labrys wisconsinensis TaxID=425677 RepID=A0ABU0JJD9_9HYPH|nr:DUF1127 domain-containing protein [Labrys wisconsinensis]MDQ0474398.1 uncharacterized protein YjiS (DUF1127 family) [Labrys wisconsinensis]
MFDRIRRILDDARAARQRRAAIALLDGLSDRTLADLGVERCDIERLVDRSGPGRRRDAPAGLVHGGRFAPHGW